ncbi:MAG: GIY-YIG nuclease family protein [Patescibacteria group bacterium]
MVKRFHRLSAAEEFVSSTVPRSVPESQEERQHEYPAQRPAGHLIHGWVDIAAALQMGLNEVKKYASRKRDPLPIYSGGRFVSATRESLREWEERQPYTDKLHVSVFRHAQAVFVGEKKLAGGGVYGVVAEGAGRIKIGWTDALHKRLAALETGCPFPLQVLFWIRGPRELEIELHRKCAKDRAHLEWFTHTADVHEALLEALRVHGGAWVPQR